MKSAFKFEVSTQTFHPDISEISLYCENHLVGSCILDLVQYIDAVPKIEKIFIGDKNTILNGLDHKILLGD